MQNRDAKFDSWTYKKSDLQLAEILRVGDPDDIRSAREVLFERHNAGLARHVDWNIPREWIDHDTWVDDITQETWTALYKYASVKRVTTGVRPLLRRIAENKCAEALRRRRTEISIENDEALITKLDRGEKRILDRPVEDLFDTMEQRRFLAGIPLIPGLFSDCQRILWMLRYVLNTPVSLVARMTGKRKQTIYSALSEARKRTRDYYSSEEFDISIANEETRGEQLDQWPIDDRCIVWEFPSVPIRAEFSNDELSTLGLRSEEYMACYVSHLALTWAKEDGKLVSCSPSFLLWSPGAWEHRVVREIERLIGDPNYGFTFPPAYQVEVNLDSDGNLTLTHKNTLLFGRSESKPNESVLDDRGRAYHFLMHSPRLLMPATPLGVKNVMPGAPWMVPHLDTIRVTLFHVKMRDDGGYSISRDEPGR